MVHLDWFSCTRIFLVLSTYNFRGNKLLICGLIFHLFLLLATQQFAI